MTDLWSVVAVERGVLADDVAGLTPEQWASPSLCSDWTVRDVVAHLTAVASTSPGAFFAQFARAGFNFDRYENVGLSRRLGADTDATLARFCAVKGSTTSPPGPKQTWLGEVVIHAEDIRRPLGITHNYDPAAVRDVADFYKSSNALIGAKNRIAGLALKASDQDWSTGTGAAVEGPLLSLLMAMTGRKAHVEDLTGEGVETLRSRCP